MALQQSDGSCLVQVLGPLRASLDGEELDLGGPKQQLLLALLLKECDRVVTREHLIDGLWADDPPATAKKALQVHVSNLRRAVGEQFPLRTAPGGYLIQSTSLELDAAVFEELVTRGTALLRTDPGAACRVLEDALALWSGPAYANVADAEPLATEVARLNELRLRAMTNRLDGELRLGHHAEVVGELETLTTDQPYDEQLRALHMMALYRSGRQTDALRAYQRTRTILREELGIEPSAELQALERQILEHSSELDLDDLGQGERYAFLATDLVASTPMWEAEPELMQHALARHDEILHDAAGANAGKVFQGTGDGVYAVFAGIADAAQAAVDAQQALDAEAWPTTQPLRVRMGVDEGPAQARGGDYFGPVMNRVSRIMSSGHGQQVLIPTVLAGAIALPARDLGAADYKGVGRVEVSQIDIDGLPVEFPDLQTDRAPAVQPRQGFGHGIRGYELREHLGEGAHGVVYRAYQASVGREVAVKAIRPEFANQPEFIKRFEAEAQYVAQLEHPHIVSLYDYWRDPEGAYLAMQWLRGGSLAKSLERAPWRPPAALHLIDQIGGALTYAHRHGVIHRDLKPANVLLDEDGNAFLSDFGIATDHVEAPTAPVTSSVAYVSPEELAGDPVGVAADVYGLALLTYEILTGDRPPLGAQPASAVAVRPELPVTLDEVLARATNVDPGARFARIEDFVRALRQAFGVDVVDGRVASDAEIRNPYKGLRAFAETDAQDFHGREVLVQLLLQQVSTSLITAVVGPSGSGKSSLVRAGLLPAIRRGELARTGHTLITEMFPGSFPFEELEAALLRVAVDRPADLLSDLVTDDRGLLRVAKQILPNDDSELLLVIDQFEEIFSLTTDDEVRRNFIDALVTVGQDDRSRVRVVLTIRADFFDRPLEYPEFGALISNGLVTVAMPSEDELAVAISQPARNAGLDLEPGLVATITRDVADEPGALPLLQYALTELVTARDGPLLTIDAYNRTGGVVGAVALRAEEIYDGLSESARHVAHQVFLRLVAVDRDVDDTRRRVRRVELESLGLNETALDTVLSEFGAFRLLSFDRDPVTRGPTIEVAHEALIREWPRYRDWIDERREDLLLERRLDHATTEWLSNDRDPSFLFTGGRLEQFERWSRSGNIRITESEQEYLAAARSAADTAEHHRSSRRRRTLAIVSTLAVAALALAIVAFIQRDRANDEAAAADEQAALAAEESQRAGDEAAAADALRAATAATNRTLRLESLRDAAADEPDQELALLLALEAEALAEQGDPVALDALAHALLKDPTGTLPAGHLVELPALDAWATREPGALVVRSRDRPRIIERRIPIEDEPETVQYRPDVAPDGRKIAVGTADGIMIVDASTGEAGDPVPSPGSRALFPSVEWTSDSQLLTNTEPVGVFAVDGLELERIGELNLDELAPGPRNTSGPGPSTLLVADPDRARLAITSTLGRVDVVDTSVPLGPGAVLASHVVEGAQTIIPAWTSEGDLLVASILSQLPSPDSRFWIAPSTDLQTLQPVDADVTIWQINEVGDGTLFVGSLGSTALIDRDGTLVAGPWPIGDSSTAGAAIQLHDDRVIFQTTDTSTLAPDGIVIRSRPEGDAMRTELPGLDVEEGMIVQYLPASGLATVASQPDADATLLYHAIHVQQVWDVRGPVPIQLDHDPDQEFDRVRVSETDDGPVVIGLRDPALPGNDALTCPHCATGGVASIIDAFSGEEIGKVDIDAGFSVSGFYLSRDRRELTVFGGESTSGSLLVFDVEKNQPIGEVDVPGLSMWVVRNEELGLGYAATSAGLTIYDLETREIVDQVAIDTTFDSRILPDETGERVVIGGSERLLLAGLPDLTDPVVFANPEGLAGHLDPTGQVVIGWGSGSGAGVQLWHAATGQTLGPFMPGPVGDQHIGGAVAEVSDGSVLVWEIDPDSWGEEACALVDRTLTRSEWRTFVSETDPYDPVDCTRSA